jgi:hypothetical protein
MPDFIKLDFRECSISIAVQEADIIDSQLRHLAIGWSVARLAMPL